MSPWLIEYANRRKDKGHTKNTESPKVMKEHLAIGRCQVFSLFPDDIKPLDCSCQLKGDD
jgi:hypothetical protein